MSIAIVGAGPVGLATACLLRKHNLEVEVFESLLHKSRFSKAIALHSRTLELLEQIGVSDAVLARGVPVHKMNLYAESKKLAALDFKHLENRYPYFISLPQYDLEDILTEKLLSLEAPIHWGKKITGLNQTDVAVSLSTESGDEYHFDYVIGCDGSHSNVRTLLQANFSGDTYNSQFLVADAQLDWSGNKAEAHTFMSSRGYMLIVPLPKQRHRIVTDAHKNQFEDTPDIEQVNEALFNKGYTDIKLSKPEWISTIRYHRRLADSFRFQRVFLAGDACHIHSPVGGQGLNTGLQDAFNLVWKLAMVSAGMANDNLLDTYDVERRHIAKQVLKSTDTMTKRYVATNPVIKTVRRLLVPLLFSSAKVQRKIALDASGLAVSYNKIPNALIDTRAGQRLAGKRMEDLHQELSSTKYELLLLKCRVVDKHVLDQIHALAGSIPAIANVRVLTLAEQAEANMSDTVISAQQWPDYFSQDKNHLLLVRPDGYIHGSYKETDVEALKAELLTWTIPS